VSLTRHSTWQLLCAMRLAEEHGTTPEIEGFRCLIHQEIALRAISNRIAQQMPERLEDFNA
jgi:hypothetical protein